ncbi:MAG TPA: hypothetical protein VHL58_03605 [Thermoanaerobaculia bacterium]|nr:hypothetical protein [Thermoanaerobaculia bacterium]
MFKSSRTAILLIVAATLAFPTSSFASHSWGGYHWARTSNPFTLKLGNNLTSADWVGHFRQTIRDWNAGNTPLTSAEVTGSSNKRCSMLAGTTQVCNGTYGNNGWLGLASINITGGVHITQGSAKMNDTYFNTSTYNNTNEREHVMCQEVAHTFGLDHQSTDGGSLNTCMDYFSNTGANAGSTLSTKPNAHDFEELNTIYAHTDSTTTVSSFEGSVFSLNPTSDDDSMFDTADKWGKVVDATPDGQTTTYAKELPNGDTQITFVIWARDYGTDRTVRVPARDRE